MRKHHPKNERIKRRYLAYLQDAKRLSSSSADQAAAAIAMFEASTRWKDFAAFHIEQARSFKSQLAVPDKCRDRKAARPRDDPFAANGAEGVLPLAIGSGRLSEDQLHRR